MTLGPAPTSVFAHAYGSGHYSESAAHLAAWVTDAVRRTSLLGGTEVYGKPRTDALRNTLHKHHWGLHSGQHGDADQLFHAWDNDVWEVEYREEYVVTHRTYVRVGGATAPPSGVIVTGLRHRPSGHRLMRVLHHLPAGIEGNAGPGHIFKWYGRAAMLVDAVRGEHALLKHLRAKHKPDAVMLGGDWNLNFERLAVRHFMRGIFPAARLNTVTFKGSGTLGKRFIDMFLLWRLAEVDAPAVRESGASDHRWYTQHLAFAPGRSKP